MIPLPPEVTTQSEEETTALARDMAAELHAGDVLLLSGNLGAGKTAFVRGLAEGLGILPEEISSPTFTLVHEYRDGRLPIYHFDFFRLEDRRAAINLALDDYFFGDGISIVEWADRFSDLIPETGRWVRFEIGEGDQRRIGIQ